MKILIQQHSWNVLGDIINPHSLREFASPVNSLRGFRVGRDLSVEFSFVATKKGANFGTKNGEDLLFL